MICNKCGREYANPSLMLVHTGIGHCCFVPPPGEERDDTPEPGHPEFLKLLDQMRELHQRKAADYGTRGEDPLANLRASEAFGIPAWVGAVMRGNDKMKRIQSFVKNGELANESVEDSLLDGAAYFLLALVLFREGKAGGA